MSAYNKVNGDYCGESRHLLREILKEEWGYRGFVMSDFFTGVYDGVKAAKAGLDLEMPWTRAYGDAAGPDRLPGFPRARGRARGPRPRGRGEGHRAPEERWRAAAPRRRLAEVGGGRGPARRRAQPRGPRQQPRLPARHRHRARGPARRAGSGEGRARAWPGGRGGQGGGGRPSPGEGGGEGGGRRRGGGGLRPVRRGRVHPAEAEQGRVGWRPRGSPTSRSTRGR
jgi:Glycosyl hydrolase family 3 N terminal domain